MAGKLDMLTDMLDPCQKKKDVLPQNVCTPFFFGVYLEGQTESKKKCGVRLRVFFLDSW